MALTEPRRKCDVHGTYLGVGQYEITLRRLDELPGLPPVGTWTVDLGKRGLKRATNFIERAVARPSGKTRNLKVESGDGTEDAEGEVQEVKTHEGGAESGEQD